MRNRYYTWKCEYCGEVFKTRSLLYEHWKNLPDHHIIKSTTNQSTLHKCKYCGKEWITTNSGLHIHEKKL